MSNSKSIDFKNEFKAIFYLKPQTVLDHNLFLTNVNIFVWQSRQMSLKTISFLWNVSFIL